MKSTLVGEKASLLMRGILFTSGVIVSFTLNVSSLGAAAAHNIHIEPQPPFFSPNQLTISVGAQLTWANRTRELHTIVSDDCRSRSICSFDSGFLGPNARYSLPRLEPGRYPYHCGIHPFMRGLLTIHPSQSFSSSDI